MPWHPRRHLPPKSLGQRGKVTEGGTTAPDLRCIHSPLPPALSPGVSPTLILLFQSCTPPAFSLLVLLPRIHPTPGLRFGWASLGEASLLHLQPTLPTIRRSAFPWYPRDPRPRPGQQPTPPSHPARRGKAEGGERARGEDGGWMRLGYEQTGSEVRIQRGHRSARGTPGPAGTGSAVRMGPGSETCAESGSSGPGSEAGRSGWVEVSDRSGWEGRRRRGPRMGHQTGRSGPEPGKPDGARGDWGPPGAKV